jgi:hypothetical protein
MQPLCFFGLGLCFVEVGGFEGEAEENIQPESPFGADRGWKLTKGYDTTDAVTSSLMSRKSSTITGQSGPINIILSGCKNIWKSR